MSETQAVITNGSGKIPPAKDGKKRQFTLEFKKELVARIKKGETVGEVAAQYGLSHSVVKRWNDGEGLGLGGGQRGSKKQTKKTKSTLKKTYRRVDESAGNYILLPPPIKDAIAYLRHAQTWLYTSLAEGSIKEFDEAHDLARMALRELLKVRDK